MIKIEEDLIKNHNINRFNIFLKNQFPKSVNLFDKTVKY